MKKIFFLLFACLHFSTAYSILPPLYQSLEEIRAITQNQELQNYLPEGMPILEIKKVQTGYLLTTRDLQLFVEIKYLPATGLGPQQFKMIFHQPTKMKNNS
jgi:hypothetical protein